MKKRTLRTLLLMMLVAALSVGATFAYLTSTDSATNTFTVGKVNIMLDEAKVDEYGVEVPDADRVKENSYKLIPGHTYVKDPTVTVMADSEESYIRMVVEVSNIDAVKATFPKADYPEYYNGELFLLQNLIHGWDNSVWTYVVEGDGRTNTDKYEFRYYKTVSTLDKADLMLEPLFTEIAFPASVTAELLANLESIGLAINIEAHAIQAKGFDDASAAWTAFDAEN